MIDAPISNNDEIYNGGLSSLVSFDSKRPFICADQVANVRTALIQFRALGLYSSDDYKTIWVDRLIKCCNVAMANNIGLVMWY